MRDAEQLEGSALDGGHVGNYSEGRQFVHLGLDAVGGQGREVAEQRRKTAHQFVPLGALGARLFEGFIRP